jgi:hypothetical protein
VSAARARTRFILGALSLLWASGCEFNTSGGSNLMAGGSGGSPGDAAADGRAVDSSVDAVADAPPTDAMPDVIATGECSFPGQRICLPNNRSAQCVFSGGMLSPVGDRYCPTGSHCMSGACRPPPGAMPCASGDVRNRCPSGQVCAYYVNATGTGFDTYCGSPYSTNGGLYSTCQLDGNCQTLTCAISSVTPSNHECLYPCQQDSDCPQGGTCDRIQDPTFDGISSATVKGCF